MTQPTLPLSGATFASKQATRTAAQRRRSTPFALDERTKSIGREGIARARAALEQAARAAGHAAEGEQWAA
jgi:hypothetical protein